MEDVLEQIVGDIWDDSDVVEQEVVERAEGEYEVDGDMVISDFCELVGIDEDSFEADSETVGGWTVEMFGAYPKVADSFVYGRFTVTVLAMDGRRVEKVLVKAAPETEDEQTNNK
jgi:CBS domain containing-hemolysin-like protein